jgi:hypothetical protein
LFLALTHFANTDNYRNRIKHNFYADSICYDIIMLGRFTSPKYAFWVYFLKLPRCGHCDGCKCTPLPTCRQKVQPPSPQRVPKQKLRLAKGPRIQLPRTIKKEKGHQLVTMRKKVQRAGKRTSLAKCWSWVGKMHGTDRTVYGR